MQYQEITSLIIKSAYRVHNVLGQGFLENVYQNSLLIELEKAGLVAQSEVPISVYYDEIMVGEYYADIIVEDIIIDELKAVEKLQTKHEVQLVNYLTATKKDIGLLINFGSSVEVKRKHREYNR